MTKATKTRINASVRTLIAAQAMHWLISGERADDLAFRNAAVILQLVVGLISHD
jgi:hypothetical protein